MTVAYLTRQPLDPTALVARVADAARGGTVLFLGSVRRGTEDGPVSGIDYSAYEEMVRTQLERILTDAAARWPEARIAVQHRIGHVPTGEPSVAVAAAAPHRADAFDACRQVIEELKRRVPIWKKERFDDGSTEWREHRGPATAARRPPGG